MRNLLLWCLPLAMLAGQENIVSSGKQHPASGTSLVHFTRIAEGVYSGSKPHNEADFEYLRSIGVRYILELHFLPFLTGPEKEKARRHKIEFVSVRMNASPVSPSEKHVNQALEIMKKYQPVYVHCVLGRDRTGLVAGLYREHVLGVPKDKALHDMKEAGFRKSWFVSGLSRYFKKH
jgi:Tyrosine phosphatase family